MAEKKTRLELSKMFQDGAKPSGSDFADFIESVICCENDGIYKPKKLDSPLRISGYGEDSNLLDFFADESHLWRISQRREKELCLNISSFKKSRIFIDALNGNVGIGTESPDVKLTVNGNLSVEGDILTNGDIIFEKNSDIGVKRSGVSSYGDNIVVSGKIDKDGEICDGVGFTSKNVDTGKYEITFKRNYNKLPIVTATCTEKAQCNTISVLPISNNTIEIYIFDVADPDININPQNCAFSFISFGSYSQL